MKISVIVPTYNGYRHVVRCIDSILPQLTADMELIVVDDASDDGTFELLRKQYGADARVILVRFSENRGPAAARNAGIRLSRGNLITFCDADDEWETANLETQQAFLDQHPEADMVFSSCRTVLDADTPRTRQLAAYGEKDRVHFRSAMIRREVFDRIGLLDESLRTGEDREWLARAKSHGSWGGLLEEPLYIRHIRDDGLSAGTADADRKSRTLDAYMRGIRRNNLPAALPFDLSILIPVYNAEKYVREAIGSCVCTKYSCELILVEDGSADRSADVLCEAFSGGDLPAAATLVLRSHKGQAASRNDAFRLSQGKKILYLDADDLFLPNAPDILMDAAESQPGAALVSALCQDFISPELTEEDASVLKIEQAPYRRMLAGCMLAKRELYEAIGLFDESLPSSETAQWVLRVRDAGTQIAESENVVLARRYHKTNFGRISRQTQMNSYMSMIRSRLKKG